MEWLAEIQQLRAQIPVGIKAAQRLLARSNGDIAAATVCFHADQVAILMNKADVTYQDADRFLRAAEYDITRALSLINRERYTLTELILHKYKNNGDAVGKIELAIAFEWELTDGDGFSVSYLAHLPPVLRCFMLVCRWRDYEGWEGFSSALFFELTTFCEQLQIIGLYNLQAILLTARKRYDELSERYGKKVHNNLSQDELFTMLMKQYHQQESQIDDALITLVKNNLNVFPCRHQS